MAIHDRITPEKEDEVRRLLAETTLKQSEISELSGVSTYSVGRINRKHEVRKKGCLDHKPGVNAPFIAGGHLWYLF